MHQSPATSYILARLSLTGALAGIAGPILLLIADIIAAQFSTSYLLTRDSISSLAWASMGWIQTIGFLFIGLMVEIFAAGLFSGIRGAKGFGLGIVVLECLGFGLLLVGAFHTDIPGRPGNIDGLIHGWAASTIFMLPPVAGLLIAPTLKKVAYWRPLYRYTVITAVFALMWIAVYKIWLPPEISWFGLYERILVVAEVIWIELMALWLLRRSLRMVRKAPPALLPE